VTDPEVTAPGEHDVDSVGVVDWDLARRVAVRVSGREDGAVPYPAASLDRDFAEYTPMAERLVAEETGLHSLAGPARSLVIDRAAWIDANLRAFQRLLRPLTTKLDEAAGTGRMRGLTRRVAAVELGGVLGWMSRRVLGQYDLLLTEDDDTRDEQDQVYFVGPNIARVEQRFGFPHREFRLWIAVHELTHRAQFTGVPWLRPYFLEQVESMLDQIDVNPEQLLTSIRRVRDERRAGDVESADGGLAVLLATPEQRVVIDRLSGLMSLLEGHGDVVMNRASEGHVPHAARFHRVMHERRTQAKGFNKLVQRLLGMEAKLAQYEQGERFIAAVEAARGPRALDPVWRSAENLPTLGEIKDPQRWLTRVDAA
jgi:coenzyme F420 biosynthesis associated uncharacterized protein